MADTDITQNYTAQSGDRVVLFNLELYYVLFSDMDGGQCGAMIANSQNGGITDSRHDTDRTTFALIIDPVNVNDTSSNYQCHVYVTNPITNTKHKLQLIVGVKLSLTVNEKEEKRNTEGPPSEDLLF